MFWGVVLVRNGEWGVIGVLKAVGDFFELFNVKSQMVLGNDGISS